MRRPWNSRGLSVRVARIPGIYLASCSLLIYRMYSVVWTYNQPGTVVSNHVHHYSTILNFVFVGHLFCVKPDRVFASGYVSLMLSCVDYLKQNCVQTKHLIPKSADIWINNIKGHFWGRWISLKPTKATTDTSLLRLLLLLRLVFQPPRPSSFARTGHGWRQKAWWQFARYDR